MQLMRKLANASLVWLLTVSLLAPVAAGCQGASEDGEDVVSADSDLTAGDLKAAAAALDVAIGELRAHIATLEQQIATTEAENKAKETQYWELYWSIKARKDELAAKVDKQNRDAVLFCVFGFCQAGVISALVAWENDGLLKDLNAQLAAVQQDQALLQGQIATYHQKKDALDLQLADLRLREDDIVKLLAAKDTAPSKLERLAKRTDRMTALKDNLQTQATTLAEVRDLATELGAVIDTTLASVAKASAKADELAASARDASYDLLMILSADDPNAAAEKWLEKTIAAKTKELLKQIGWDPDGLIERLVERAFPGQAQSAGAQQLRAELKQALALTDIVPTP